MFRARIFAVVALSAILTTPWALLSCDPPVADNFIDEQTLTIDGYLSSDGLVFGSNGASVPSSAEALSFMAEIRAPQGTWSMTVSADGALAVAGAEGMITRTFTSNGGLQQPSDGGASPTSTGASSAQSSSSPNSASASAGSSTASGGASSAQGSSSATSGGASSAQGSSSANGAASSAHGSPSGSGLGEPFAAGNAGNIFAFPVTIVQPAGVGIVHITVGPVSRDFRFVVGTGQIEVTGVIEAGEVFYDAGGTGARDATVQGSSLVQVPTGSGSLSFLATVTTPPGGWTLTVAAEGAVQLAGGTASATRNFLSGQPDASGQINGFSFPLTVVDPTLLGFVHVTVGTFSRTFTFAVMPIGTEVQICGSTLLDAGCAEASGLTGSPVDDGDANTLPVTTPPTDFVQGVRFSIRIQPSVSAAPAGEVWPVNIATSGSVALVGGDGGVLNAERLLWTSGALIVPAVVVSEGAGIIAASLGVGPPTQMVVNAGAAVVGVRRVAFASAVGVLAQNVVTVCTQSSQGLLSAILAGDAGALAATTVNIDSPPLLDCPSGYNGSAEFLWTGSSPVVEWSFSTGDATTAPVAVAMKGTSVCAVAERITSGATLVTLPGDAGTKETLYLVAFSLMRNPDDGGAAPTPCMFEGGVPVSNASFTVVVPPTIGVASTTATDINGQGFFQLTAPPYLQGTLTPIVVVQGEFSVPVPFNATTVDGG